MAESFLEISYIMVKLGTCLIWLENQILTLTFQRWKAFKSLLNSNAGGYLTN
jgi:hypothetical protein